MRLCAFLVFPWLAAFAVVGCRHRDAATDAADARNNIAKLQSPDAGQRRDGAKDLTGQGPPAEAIGPLLAAAQRENVPRALQAELLALGASGAAEAEPIISGHLEDPDKSTRQAAQRAFKTWRSKNGQAVRADVVTRPASAAAAPTGPAPDAAGDGCIQFKEICAADPFSVDACKADLAKFDKTKLESWADCVNASSFGCQKAHESCVAKIKSQP